MGMFRFMQLSVILLLAALIVLIVIWAWFSDYTSLATTILGAMGIYAALVSYAFFGNNEQLRNRAVFSVRDMLIRTPRQARTSCVVLALLTLFVGWQTYRASFVIIRGTVRVDSPLQGDQEPFTLKFHQVEPKAVDWSGKNFTALLDRDWIDQPIQFSVSNNSHWTPTPKVIDVALRNSVEVTVIPRTRKYKGQITFDGRPISVTLDVHVQSGSNTYTFVAKNGQLEFDIPNTGTDQLAVIRAEGDEYVTEGQTSISPESTIGFVLPVVQLPSFSGGISVSVWNPQHSGRHGRNVAEALPLRAGDKVRIKTTSSHPMFHYILWITTEGKVQPVYPWLNGSWSKRTNEQPNKVLPLPDDGAKAYGFKVDENGMETLVLLLRQTRLPESVEIESLLPQLPKQVRQDAGSVAYFDNGKVVLDDPDRSLVLFDPQDIHDPVVQTQSLLYDSMKAHFDVMTSQGYAVSAQEP